MRIADGSNGKAICRPQAPSLNNNAENAQCTYFFLETIHLCLKNCKKRKIHFLKIINEILNKSYRNAIYFKDNSFSDTKTNIKLSNLNSPFVRIPAVLLR